MSLCIRFATPDDAAAIQAIYAPYCGESTVSFETQPPTVEQMRERVTQTLERLPWLVCEIDGVVGGYAYASPHRERAAFAWSVEVAVYIAENFQRRSVGRALYIALCELLQRQGYFVALAGISTSNAGSIAMHEALGFKLIGVYESVGYKAGQWIDLGWWQLRLRPTVANPLPPIRIGDLECSTLNAALERGERCFTPQKAITP